MPKFKKILCPVDFDWNSRGSLQLASELAQEGEAILYVVHVVATPPGPEGRYPSVRWRPPREHGLSGWCPRAMDYAQGSGGRRAGLLPMSREEANLFFRLVARRYERASLIITSNRVSSMGVKCPAIRCWPPLSPTACSIIPAPSISKARASDSRRNAAPGCSVSRLRRIPPRPPAIQRNRPAETLRSFPAQPAIVSGARNKEFVKRGTSASAKK